MNSVDGGPHPRIEFRRYDPHTDLLLNPLVVECYREVFACDKAWHEWKKCPRCPRSLGKWWGKNEETQRELERLNFRCDVCGANLVDYWPRKKVLADLKREVGSKTSCWIALDGELVVGFCWGYPVELGELEHETKLSLFEPLKTFGWTPNTHVAYQNEVGVLTSHQERGIAKEMVGRRLEDFHAQNIEIGVVRTREAPIPSVTYLWYVGSEKKREGLGYQVIKRYGDGDGRVILAGNLHRVSELLHPKKN